VKDLTIGEAQKLTAPAPFGLLTALRPDGKTNVMAVSWWNYVTNHPPMLSVCLSQKGLSGTLIRESGEFGLSIVGESLRETALKCGQCSGRAQDKAAEYGIPLEKGQRIAAQVVSGSRAVFECVLADSVDAGDHTIYIGEIVTIRGDPAVPQIFAYDGYARLDTASKQ